MLAGFVEATSGDILIEGKPMRGIPPHKRNIGVVFQSYALFPHLTVFDNVAFGLKMRNVRALHRLSSACIARSTWCSSRGSISAIHVSCPAVSSSALRLRARS